MTASSNIRVSINFTQSTVFAGEDVECIISFKNIASPAHGNTQATTSQNRRHRKLPPAPQSQLKKTNRPPIAQTIPTPHDTDHRPVQTRRPTHGRSLSIISLTSEGSVVFDRINHDDQSPIVRSNKGHSRSTSLQIQSRKVSSGPLATSNSQTIFNSPTDTLPKTTNPSIVLQDVPLPIRSRRSNSVRSEIGNSNTTSSHRKYAGPPQDFKFPPASNTAPTTEGIVERDQPTSPKSLQPPRRESPKIADSSQGSQDSLNPVTRFLSGTSVNGGTPRSSLDLYSMSNHSDETLASEYPTQPVIRQSVRNSQYRKTSKLPNVEEDARPEVLMMGYAQVTGSFTLDGSLVNQGPFEEVKRKGVVGGQGGGGVVGVDRKKRDSGLFGAFGWGNIGESIGGLLGSGELSSIKEMRTIANSRAIPILSTPQSILFVDLHLKPGESQRYSFKFTLPKGLPPSHKGRAIKVSYNITIGIQRPGLNNEQRIRSIDVPFRVFGTVNCTFSTYLERNSTNML
jgi:hypothetical protein